MTSLCHFKNSADALVARTKKLGLLETTGTHKLLLGEVGGGRVRAKVRVREYECERENESESESKSERARGRARA